MTNMDVFSDRLDLPPVGLAPMQALQRWDRQAVQLMTSYRIPGDWPLAIESVRRL